MNSTSCSSIFRHTITGLAVATAFLSTPLPAADSFPNRPVRFIVTFPPGGGLDLMSRIVGRTLTETWGQQVIIENRPGAGGIVGADVVAKSPPDGHTLFIASNGEIAISPNLYKKMAYDTVRDLVPLGISSRTPSVLVVRSSGTSAECRICSSCTTHSTSLRPPRPSLDRKSVV